MEAEDFQETSSISTTREILNLSPFNTHDGSRRLLELELMHRWTTSTYLSLCSSAEDIHCLQVDVPRWALKNDYLLDGMLAMSALEVAICEQDIGDVRQAYIQAAMDYYDKSSTSFRSQFSESSIGPENIHCFYMYSCLVWPINISMPQAQQTSAVSRITTLMDLTIGSSSIALIDWSGLMESPMAPMIRAAAATFSDNTGPDALAVTTKEVFARLTFIVDRAYILKNPGLSTSHILLHFELATKLVTWLQTCFVVEAKESGRGFSLGFPAFAGQSFASAVKKAEPLALFILMHWAVLLDGLKNECWWVGSIGQELVQEISLIPLQEQSQIVEMPEYQQNIAWARQKVGLFEKG